MSARSIRRRAFAVLMLFACASAVLHFALGSAVSTISPQWKYPPVPDEALSIVTLSHRPPPLVAPTPTPTPPPIPLPRTKRKLAVLKYREIGLGVHLRPDVRPPARRKSRIILERPVPPRPHDRSRDADVVAAMPEPTPQTSAAPGSARADTGGSSDLSGSMQWGDDNPPRALKLMPLSVPDHASGTARVAVDVDPDGRVTGAHLIQSSGDAAVDAAALDAAQHSQFSPATANGVPVHGTCIVEYGPGPAAQSI